jgi:hypothetical protein
MCNLLKCEICNYQSKQLFQHIKSVHNLSVDEYRKLFGMDRKMQINFNPPELSAKNKYNSDYVKNGYKKIKNKIECINQIYSKDETIHLLNSLFYYKNYFGKAKNRTLINQNPKLYKSIYEHTKELEKIFTENNKYNSNFNFKQRLIFLVELNCEVDRLKCQCGRVYTWNNYCRKCPDYHRSFTGKTHNELSKNKIRTSVLKYLEELNGQLIPRYNKKSIPILEQKAKELGITDLQHAENGGEFYIRGLGYWVDGYSKEKNIVIEYDERHHYDVNGNLKERDVQRQLEIQKYLNCKFIRISEV